MNIGVWWVLKNWKLVLLMLTLGGASGAGVKAWRWWQERQQVQATIRQQLETEVGSLQVALTSRRLEKDSVAAMLAAAKALNGELIVAIRILVPRRDTLVVHDTVTTEILSDSSRVARFRDSTFAGIIDATVTAPPFPAQLGVQYSLTRPAFSPSIGVIRSGAQHYVSVSWAGELIEVPVAFANVPLPEPRVSAYVESARSVDRWRASSGVQLRVRGPLQAFGELQAQLHESRVSSDAWIGVRYRFR